MTNEEHIIGLKAMKPYIQKKMRETNYEGLGELDAREVGETIDFAIEAIKALEKQKSMQWIPITFEPITDEEGESYGYDEDITYMFTCPLPADGDEILISRNNGKWVDLVVFCNDDYGVGDEDGNDWIDEVEAWMPLPKGYAKEVSE